MSPSDLAHVLRLLPPAAHHPRVIVGTETMDDAGVFQITDDIALVQTADFFTPVVDDPFTFGQIAAANALSDVYAMGGEPITAMNLVAFPKGLDKHILADIIRGGLDKVSEAGAALVGGHTVDDDEPKYGLAVTGTIHPKRIITNAGGKPGDRLILTKPLGIGVIATAMKNRELPRGVLEQAITTMTTLNAAAAQVMQRVGVNACTDVTGFGFLGHLHELTAGSGLSARIDAENVPLLASAAALADEGFVCGGSQANRDYLDTYVTWDDRVAEAQRILLTDAITSGGLLIAVSPEKAEDLIQQLSAEENVLAAVDVGALVPGRSGHITVV